MASLGNRPCLLLMSAVFAGVRRSTTPNKFSVKEYCPVVFRDLRQRFGVDPEVYLVSRVLPPLLVKMLWSRLACVSRHACCAR